jgi:hypothetical protein
VANYCTIFNDLSRHHFGVEYNGAAGTLVTASARAALTR